MKNGDQLNENLSWETTILSTILKPTNSNTQGNQKYFCGDSDNGKCTYGSIMIYHYPVDSVVCLV